MCQSEVMTRRKTTLYLDPDVVTATKVIAATTARSESDVVEAALRAYLRTAEVDAAAKDLSALMARLAESSELDDDAAMAIAVEEVRAVRKSRRR